MLRQLNVPLVLLIAGSAPADGLGRRHRGAARCRRTAISRPLAGVLDGAGDRRQPTEDPARIVQALTAAFAAEDLNTKVVAADALRTWARPLRRRPARWPPNWITSSLGSALRRWMPWRRSEPSGAGAAAYDPDGSGRSPSPCGDGTGGDRTSGQGALPALEEAAAAGRCAARASGRDDRRNPRSGRRGTSRRRGGASFRDMQEPVSWRSAKP
jgi:hypothetical protein